MESRIMQVFYGNDCLPYKDSARSVHYPIVGNSFVGANNTTQIRFYVRDIGGVNNVTWVAISKLPNGKIGNQVLSSVHLDAELNEYYVALDLSSYYTQVKGDVYISLNGYQGGVQVTQDQGTGIYSITGTPTIEATGSIKLSINYSTQLPLGQHFNISDLQQILGAMSDKANVANTIQVITTIDSISPDDYDDGQYFYDLSAKEYYYIDDGYIKLVENSSGILGSDRVLIRYSTSDEALNWNGLLDTLYEIVGSKLCIVNYSNKDYLVQFTKKLLVTEEPGITIFDLATKCLYYKETITDIDTFALIITSTYKIEYVEKKSTINTVYGINASAQQTNVPYGVLVVNNALVQRGETGQIIVPQTPTADTHATSKKYVDDSIATIKSNQFIIVDTTTFPTLEDFLDSTGEEGYIYLYPINLADLTKGYYQYIWEGNDWLDIGTTQIDLSNYYTKPQVDSIANGKVDKTSSASKLYGTNASGNQTTISFTSSNNGSTIPLRDNDGNVGVALTPTNNMHATSKYYVDAQLSLKVDKTSGSNKVYGTDSSGNQKTFDIDNTVGADGNIVRRASVTSQIMVPLTPTANGHASSKKYVDDSVANAISNVYKIKGSKTVAEINALTDMQVGDVYNLLDSGEITLGELQVFTGDNIVWLGSAWDKLGAEIDWHAYDEKFMAAGFFEVEEYDEDTGEVTIVYATELYDMSYNGDTGVMTIEAN